MITYKFGDIVLVPFPFTDQTSVKKAGSPRRKLPRLAMT